MTAAPAPRYMLTAEAARVLTDEVKADAAALWAKLLELYEGGAHLALGYSSWGAYCSDEFDMGKSRSYQVLDAARVIEALPESTNCGMRSALPVDAPRSEGVARELVPVLRADPESIPEVWGEVVAEKGPQPTAAEVREVVSRHVTPKQAKAQGQLITGIVEKARLIEELAPHLDLGSIESISEEEKQEWKQQLLAARAVLSRVIAAL